MAGSYDNATTHLDAIRQAWSELKEAIVFQVDCLRDPDAFGPALPLPIAWLCAPWDPLAYRLRPYNLERLFRPRKAARRWQLSQLREFAFVLGAAEMTDEQWAEADVLVAEFGGGFPPRDWQPMSAADTVGMIMGYTREEVAVMTA